MPDINDERPIIYIQPRENLPKTTKDANFLAFMRDLGSAIKARAGLPARTSKNDFDSISHALCDGHGYFQPNIGTGEGNIYLMYTTYSVAMLHVHCFLDNSGDWSDTYDLLGIANSSRNITRNDIRAEIETDNLGRKYVRVTNLTSGNIGLQWWKATSRGSAVPVYSFVMQGTNQLLYANGGSAIMGALLDDYLSEIVDNTPSLAAQDFASTIRSLDGVTVPPSVVIPTIDSNLGDYLTDIANAIRDKKGITPHEGNEINAQNFATEVTNIPQGGGS